MCSQSTSHFVQTLGSGKLIYLIGASGSGKDSILNMACAQAIAKDKLIIAPRYITRPSDKASHDIALSKKVFNQHLEKGSFLFDWRAHGYEYGIAIQVLDSIKAGHNLLINGSRAYMSTAREIYPCLIVIGVLADQGRLQARLLKRGRENTSSIDERLERNQSYHNCLADADFVIDNNQKLIDAVLDLLRIIRLD